MQSWEKSLKEAHEYVQYDRTHAKKKTAPGGKAPRRKILTQGMLEKLAASKGGKGRKGVPPAGVKKPHR